MEISKLTLALKGLFGGVSGIVAYLLDQFNSQVLSHLTPEEAAKYCADVNAVCLCVSTIIDNHAASMSEQKRVALTETLAALTALSDALADAKITPEELDRIIDEVKDAIEAWKEAK